MNCQRVCSNPTLVSTTAMATNDISDGGKRNTYGTNVPPAGSPSNHHNGDAANQKNMTLPDFLPLGVPVL